MDWCRRNFLEPEGAEPRFLQRGREGAAAAQAQLRVEQLGERLFNLQGIPGFSSRVELLKSSSLLSAISEFDAAGLMMQSDLKFVFNKPVSRKRSDFEGTLVLPSGSDACWEVKMKEENTVLSNQSILERFKTALKQIPNVPTIIVLYLPESWMRQRQNIELAIARANALWFGRSKRTVAVIYFWEQWQELENGSVVRVVGYWEYHNERSRFYDARNRDIVKRGG